MKAYKELQQAKSKPMAIIKNEQNEKNGKEEKNEQKGKIKGENKVVYSLTSSLIDPANFSPPNLFLETLKKRMTIY